MWFLLISLQCCGLTFPLCHLKCLREETLGTLLEYLQTFGKATGVRKGMLGMIRVSVNVVHVHWGVFTRGIVPLPRMLDELASILRCFCSPTYSYSLQTLSCSWISEYLPDSGDRIWIGGSFAKLLLLFLFKIYLHENVPVILQCFW